jgi:hypothetical protein
VLLWNSGPRSIFNHAQAGRQADRHSYWGSWRERNLVILQMISPLTSRQVSDSHQAHVILRLRGVGRTYYTGASWDTTQIAPYSLYNALLLTKANRALVKSSALYRG